MGIWLVRLVCWVVYVGVALFIAGVIYDSLPATAGEDRGAWFKSLKDPTGLSCCDVADCKQTQAKYQGGWFAIVRGVVRAVPPDKVLRKPYSLDGEAYVCASNNGPPEGATIFCFIPPTLGY